MYFSQLIRQCRLDLENKMNELWNAVSTGWLGELQWDEQSGESGHAAPARGLRDRNIASAVAGEGGLLFGDARGHNNAVF